MQNPTLRALLFAGAALAMAAPLNVARADTPASQPAPSDQSGNVNELVVTAPHYVPVTTSAATKTATPIIETPQSETVINRDEIDVLNWQSTQQAVRYTAGVDGENFGPDQRYDYVTVRGFYPVEYIDGLQAPIAPASSLNDIGVDLWGFDSIQILKGPASVLYGESPPGGVLDLTSRQPQDTFSGELRGQVGNFQRYEGEGDVTGQIAPGVDARLTGLYFNTDTQLDFENHQRVYIAPALSWEIDPNDKLTLLAFYQWDRDAGCCGGFLPAQGTLLPNPNGVISPSRNFGEPGYNLFTRNEAGIGYEFQHAFNDNWHFQQNFKYFYYNDDTREIYGAGLAPDLVTEDRYNFVYPEDINEFALDSRVTGTFDTGPISHQLLLGVDYRDYFNTTQDGFAYAPSINAFNPVYGAPITTPPLSPYINEQQVQTGLYAQDQAKWNGFLLTLSGREDWLGNHQLSDDTQNSKFTYRVGLNYLFPMGLAPYISYATSFEPTPGAGPTGQPFAPSTGSQVEGGVKFEPTFLPRDAHLLATAAVYDIVQDNVLTPDPNPAYPYSSIQTGQVEVKGVELETVMRFFDRITVNGSYTYTDSRVTEGNPDYIGKQLFETPRDKFSLFGDYTQQTGPLAGLGGGIGVRYLSSSYGDSANQWLNPAVTLADAIIHYDVSHWRFALNANNLLNKIYVARCTSAVECFYGEEREVTFTVTRKW